MRRAGKDWKVVRTLNSINDEKEPIRGYKTHPTILISEDTHLSSIITENWYSVIIYIFTNDTSRS
jgi:hypothetical protein